MNNDDAKFLVTQFRQMYPVMTTYLSNWTELQRYCKKIKREDPGTKIRVHRQLTESEYEKLGVADIVEQYDLS